MPMEKNTIPQSEAIALSRIPGLREARRHVDERAHDLVSDDAGVPVQLLRLVEPEKDKRGELRACKILAGVHRRHHRLEVQIGAVILVLICFFGFFTARRPHSREGGVSAVIALRSKWDAELAQNSAFASLPNITGGGDVKARDEGWASAAFLPRAAMVIWVLIAITHCFLLRA